MRKVALVFVLAVLVPSLVLAWLAVRSLRDQQFLLERQQSLLYQRVTDALAQNISDYLSQQQQEFSAQVETIVGDRDARSVGAQFDSEIRQHWPLAEVGFCVTRSGKILSLPANARDEAKSFYSDNGAFLGNRESAEVYGNINTVANNTPDTAITSNGGGNGGARGYGYNNFGGSSQKQVQQSLAVANAAAPAAEKLEPDNAMARTRADTDKVQPDQPAPSFARSAASQSPVPGVYNSKAKARKVTPQNESFQVMAKDAADEDQKNLSRVIPAEGEFNQLIGSGTDGMLARFLQNKLNLMFWHRLNRDPDLIFGAQLNLTRVVDGLRDIVQADPELRDQICLVLLDDNAKPVVFSRQNFHANWKRPFAATEIGDALPHWEVAAYLVDPTSLTRTVCYANLVIGLLIAVLVLAIILGSWLIIRNLNLELTLARQKTDFVSNVSHELKTPLTSIRMFSELLADGRVTDEAKQRSYLNIITAEAARLTRLINNVLDFSRMESGEKKYNFSTCDLTEVVRSTAETFRPHLEANGFKLDCELPSAPVSVQGDADALSQIIVNLLSNAEKYSNGGKEIGLQLALKQSPLPHAEIKVLDRGPGVPRGSEEKVFEKFYRAHDSLASGIQGSGLGLTIARQIARAHGGDVAYESRDAGGSCFVLRLPIKSS
ncbi:MAG TPA: HAMP domain-containing sensor histidine kinase [Candidatus Acidoferrales bacterium]|jgi:signal transduction histidine kinase|nr:HAMP domain-containing sensor histidine kinase [Candidatus Acidoferrales bacterium]